MNRQRVEVVRGDDLVRERWVFTVFDFPMVLLEYFGGEERKTRRHKWRATRKYERLGVRRGPYYEGMIITEEPEIPEDVVVEAVKKLGERLEFQVWTR